MPPGRQNADKLVGGLLLIGCEHDTEGRKDHIEAGFGKGKSFRIGFLKRHGKPVGFRAFAPSIEKRADIVRRHDIGEPAGGGERCIAIAGSNIEDALVAAKIDGLAERFADNLQRDANDGIVAGTPRSLLAALDRGEINGGGDGCWNIHCAFPSFSNRRTARLPGYAAYGRDPCENASVAPSSRRYKVACS